MIVITDVGGLLGLYLGCSMMSLTDIVHLPLRAFLNWHKKRKSQKVTELNSTANQVESQPSNIPQDLAGDLNLQGDSG